MTHVLSMFLRPIELLPGVARAAGRDPIVVGSGPHVGHQVTRIDRLEEAGHPGLVLATCSCGSALEIPIDIDDDAGTKDRIAELEDELEDARKGTADDMKRIDAAELEANALQSKLDDLRVVVARLERERDAALAKLEAAPAPSRRRKTK
jgi:hypothetical protein